jgi:hypothetical protein
MLGEYAGGNEEEILCSGANGYTATLYVLQGQFGGLRRPHHARR